MSVLIFTNLLSGNTGLDKSVIMTANHLHRAGYAASLVNIVGPGDGSRYLSSRWPLDLDVPTYALQTIPADSGRHLYANMLPAIKGRIPNLSYSFTENALLALREIAQRLDENDAVLFTHPLQTWLMSKALAGEHRRFRGILQVHGDYRVLYPELHALMIDSQHVVDELQVVASGLLPDYTDLFPSDRISWIPNIHEPTEVPRIAHDGVNIVLIGSFQTTKNQLDAVRVIERLLDTDAMLTFWGNAANKYGEYVRNYALQRGVIDRIRFAGVGTEREIYGTADIVIIPSRSEGFGYALLEAAANGIPVVAYDYKYGPRDVIAHGESGFIVGEGDVDALAASTRRLVVDAQMRADFGRIARGIFESSFTPRHILDRYDTLLGKYRTAHRGEMIPTDVIGSDPIVPGSMRTRPLAIAGRPVLHLVHFRSTERLRRFKIHSTAKVRSVKPFRLGNRYILPVLTGDPGRRIHRARQRVVSYETSDEHLGRFYLGNTTNRRQFEVGRYLLREPGIVLPSQLDPNGALQSNNSATQTDFEIDDGRLYLARHPRRLVTAAVDNFGVPANTAGGVRVSNSPDVRRPYVTIQGEFDWVDLSDPTGVRRFQSPLSYRELYERVLYAEREFELFDYSVLDDIHVWELYRAAFIAHISEALGLWAPQFHAGSVGTWDAYVGEKSLERPPKYERILFEFPRKGDGADRRTLAFQSPDTLIIEYPQAYGYSSTVYTQPNRYPIGEYLRWRRTTEVSGAGVCDPRPIEAALSASLEMPVRLGDQLDTRLTKFLHEREYWRGVFEKVGPAEVVIPSSHWSAGICEAARCVGAVAADVQYALTSELHPSYWFGDTPRHGARRFYAWSEFWARRTNGYEEWVVEPRRDVDNVSPGSSDASYDVCIVSQPRVGRRMLQFVRELAHLRPDLRICVAPHPDERAVIAGSIEQAGLGNAVHIAGGTTIEAIRGSTICVGGYSTSLYEAAALGKSVYVLPVPGHEIVEREIASGLFRLVTDPACLDPFEVPDRRAELFPATEPADRLP